MEAEEVAMGRPRFVAGEGEISDGRHGGVGFYQKVHLEGCSCHLVPETGPSSDPGKGAEISGIEIQNEVCHSIRDLRGRKHAT